MAKIGGGSEKQKNCVFILLFARLALLCHCVAKIGGGSEKQKKLRFYFAFRSPCTTLPLRG